MAHDEEMEGDVLASALRDAPFLRQCLPVLKEHSFSSKVRAWIWRTLSESFRRTGELPAPRDWLRWSERDYPKPPDREHANLELLRIAKRKPQSPRTALAAIKDFVQMDNVRRGAIEGLEGIDKGDLPGAAGAMARAVATIQSTAMLRDLESFEVGWEERIKFWESPEKTDLLRALTPWPSLDRALGGGMLAGNLGIIVGFSGTGKCLTGETPVSLANGRRVPIREVQDGDVVLTYSAAGFRPFPVRRLDQGEKEVFLIKTRTGRQIKATASHPLLTQCGWKPVSEIPLGEKIGLPGYTPFFGTESVGVAFAELVGAWVADGCSGSSRISSSKDHVVKALTDLAVSSGLGATHSPTFKAVCITKGADKGRRAHRLINFLRETGLFNKKSTQRFVPEPVFSWRREDVAAFLRGVFYDGSLSIGRKRFALEYSTSSEQLARGVQHLLLRFGAPTRVTSRKTYRADSWRVCASKLSIIERILDEIGLAKRPDVEARARAKLKVSRGKSGAPCKGSRWIPEGPSELIFDELVSVEPCGREEVFDLSVIGGPPNFIAGDIIVHNSACSVDFGFNALMTGHHVVVADFTTEETREERIARYYARLTGVDRQTLVTGRFSWDERARIFDRFQNLNGLSNRLMVHEIQIKSPVSAVGAFLHQVRDRHPGKLLVLVGDSPDHLEADGKVQDKRRSASEVYESIKCHLMDPALQPCLGWVTVQSPVTQAKRGQIKPWDVSESVDKLRIASVSVGLLEGMTVNVDRRRMEAILNKNRLGRTKYLQIFTEAHLGTCEWSETACGSSEEEGAEA